MAFDSNRRTDSDEIYDVNDSTSSKTIGGQK